MAALLLVGAGGWSQRWEIAAGHEAAVSNALADVGSEGVGRLQVMDLETDSEVELVVAWHAVATAVILPTAVSGTPGQYP
jgi:hypothetical protein